MRHRQITQNESVEQAENGGVGADTEGKSEYGDGRESRRFAQHTKGETNVLEQSFEEADAARVAEFFVDLVVRADGEAGAAPRFIERNTGCDKFFDLLFEMEAQLVVQASFDGVLPEERAKTQTKIIEHESLGKMVARFA